MKSIVFAGTSQTWGEGLHYYSDLPNLNLDADSYNKEDYTSEHLEFIQNHRYSRIVANYFNTKDIVRKENGGHNDMIVDFVKHDINFNDCDYIIFQFTDPFRDLIKFNYKGTERTCNVKLQKEVVETEFEKYIDEKWNFNIHGFIDYFLSEKVKIIQKNIEEFENKGIKKCFIINERTDFYRHFNKNNFFSNRLIKIKIDDFVFDTIDDASFGKRGIFGLQKGRKLEIIKNDSYLIKKYGKVIQNRHLTLESHKIVAENIIDTIKKEG